MTHTGNQTAEIAIESPEGYDLQDLSVTVLNKGGFVVLGGINPNQIDGIPDILPTGVLLQVMDTDGNTIKRITDSDNIFPGVSNLSEPTVQALPDGSFLLAAASKSLSGLAPSAIYYQQFDQLGNLLGDAGVITATGNLANPKIAVFEDGQFYIAAIESQENALADLAGITDTQNTLNIYPVGSHQTNTANFVKIPASSNDYDIIAGPDGTIFGGIAQSEIAGYGLSLFNWAPTAEGAPEPVSLLDGHALSKIDLHDEFINGHFAIAALEENGDLLLTQVSSNLKMGEDLSLTAEGDILEYQMSLNASGQTQVALLSHTDINGAANYNLHINSVAREFDGIDSDISVNVFNNITISSLTALAIGADGESLLVAGKNQSNVLFNLIAGNSILSSDASFLIGDGETVGTSGGDPIKSDALNETIPETANDTGAADENTNEVDATVPVTDKIIIAGSAHLKPQTVLAGNIDSVNIQANSTANQTGSKDASVTFFSKPIGKNGKAAGETDSHTTTQSLSDNGDTETAVNAVKSPVIYKSGEVVSAEGNSSSTDSADSGDNASSNGSGASAPAPTAANDEQIDFREKPETSPTKGDEPIDANTPNTPDGKTSGLVRSIGKENQNDIVSGNTSNELPGKALFEPIFDDKGNVVDFLPDAGSFTLNDPAEGIAPKPSETLEETLGNDALLEITINTNTQAASVGIFIQAPLQENTSHELPVFTDGDMFF